MKNLWRPFEFVALGAVAALVAISVLGLVYPKVERPRPVSVGTFDLAKVGCAYIRDVGESHGLPVSECLPVSAEKYPTGTGLARFRVTTPDGQTFMLRLRFVHSAWQVTAAENK